jgi:coenzyme f390 synthetase, putative
VKGRDVKMKESLYRMLKHSIECEFYKNKFFKIDIDNVLFDDIPITTKEELRDTDAYSLLAESIGKVAQYHETTGTTGEPVSSWRSYEDLSIYANQINESYIDFNSNDILFNRFPYSMSLPAHTIGKAVSDKGGCIIAASRATPIMPYTRAIKIIHDLRVTVVACNVMEAFLLAEVAKKMGFNPLEDFSSLRALCVAGEMLTPNRMKRLKKIWGVEVFDFFGMTETGNIATNCECGNMHISNDFYCEILDDDSRSLGYNTFGNLYVSALNKKATPVVRYDVGDVAMIQKSNCKCGNKADILVHHGRKKDIIEIKGKRNTLRQIQEAMLEEDNGIGNFWKFFVNDDILEIYVETSNERELSEVKLNLEIPYKIIPVQPEQLYPIEALLESTTFSKPNYFLSKVQKENIL